MLRRMTPQQFREWQAYAELEPFDERRADYRAASIVTMLANVNRDSEKRKKPFQIGEFVLNWDQQSDEAKPKQTVAQQKSLLMALAMATSSDKE